MMGTHRNVYEFDAESRPGSSFPTSLCYVRIWRGKSSVCMSPVFACCESPVGCFYMRSAKYVWHALQRAGPGDWFTRPLIRELFIREKPSWGKQYPGPLHLSANGAFITFLDFKDSQIGKPPKLKSRNERAPRSNCWLQSGTDMSAP